MNCPKCKATIPDESKFCPQCGEKLLSSDVPTVADEKVNKANEKSKMNVKEAKQGCLGCLGIIAIVMIVAALLGSFGGNKSNPVDTKPVSTDINTESPVKAESLEAYGRRLITQVVGKKGADGHETIQNISGLNGVLFATVVSKDFLTASTALRTIQNDSKEIFKRAYADRNDIQQVSINWQLPLVDKYGNSKLGTVVKVALNKDTAERINWSQISSRDIDKWADVWWTHPAIEE